MMVSYPGEILNRIKWSDGGLNGVKVTYVHRKAPGDVLTMSAEKFTSLRRSFFSTEKV